MVKSLSVHGALHIVPGVKQARSKYRLQKGRDEMGQQLRTFPRGVFPLHDQHHGKRKTQDQAIQAAAVPDTLVIPVLQHLGTPCVPLVKKGDRVLMGQTIASIANGKSGSPVHSSVSGEVVAVEPRMHPSGTQVVSIVIRNDHLDEAVTLEAMDWEKANAAQLRERIHDAGIVGMGGAAFPTHLKLTPPKDSNIHTVILNGAECEPYLTGDHRLMLEKAEGIVTGLRIVMKVLSAARAIIGIEDNKPDAIRAMAEASKGIPGISVQQLKTKYPQGAEKQMIQALTGKQVPLGGYPYNIGIEVQNAATAYAVMQAVEQGMPLLQRVVTVTGPAVSKGANFLARIGTPVGYLIQQAGGDLSNAGKILLGGPMMGQAVFDADVPLIKGSSGIVVLGRDQAQLEKPSPCIRCGLCARSCPLKLQPLWIAAYSERDMFEQADQYHAKACCECGTCNYVCPANRPLLQAIRTAKMVLNEQTHTPETAS